MKYLQPARHSSKHFICFNPSAGDAYGTDSSLSEEALITGLEDFLSLTGR